MTIELNREAIARIAALPGVAEAAEAGSALISLWPLTEAMLMWPSVSPPRSPYAMRC